MYFAVFVFLLAICNLIVNGAAPPPVTFQFHPNGDNNWCVSAVGSYNPVNAYVSIPNNSPVILSKCVRLGAPYNGSQDWAASESGGMNYSTSYAGPTKLRGAGDSKYLDASSHPANGVKMKVYDGFDVPQQQWYYTPDRRLALENQHLCLDLTDGKKVEGNVLQVWHCTKGNTNQIWTATAP